MSHCEIDQWRLRQYSVSGAFYGPMKGCSRRRGADHEKERHTRNFVLCELAEVVQLTLIRRTAPMPEEHPLQTSVAFKLVLETKLILCVILLQ